MVFRPKNCRHCSTEFIPTSGVQVSCVPCRTTCSSCGTPRGNYARTGGVCQSCAAKTIRKFSRTCSNCASTFQDTNNKTLLCPLCTPKEGRGICKLCDKPVSKRATSCNSCRAKAAPPPKNRFVHNYEMFGIMYRSSWEAAFAKLLTTYGVHFEYEKYSKGSKNFPDFYITALDEYLEIHPDWYGSKRLPSNCILVKSLASAKAAALLITWRINKTQAREAVGKMPRRQLGYSLHNMRQLANYLQAEIIRCDAEASSK